MAYEFGDGLRWIGMRYTNVFGTGEDHKGPMASIISQLLRAAAHRETLHLFEDTLEACRDYVPVDVVARTCADLLNARIASGIYNIGSGCPISFSKIIDWCARLSSKPPRVQLVPNPVHDSYQYWTCADMSKLSSALGSDRWGSAEDLFGQAERLYRHFDNGCLPSLAH